MYVLVLYHTMARALGICTVMFSAFPSPVSIFTPSSLVALWTHRIDLLRMFVGNF